MIESFSLEKIESEVSQTSALTPFVSIVDPTESSTLTLSNLVIVDQKLLCGNQFFYASGLQSLELKDSSISNVEFIGC